MPAMHDQVFEAMDNMLDHRRDLMLRTLKFDMTHDECISLVAPSEDINLLKTASKVAQVSSADDWMIIQAPAVLDGVARPQVMLMMRTHAQQTPPLRPRYPEWQRQHSEVGQKVLAWLEQRLIIGRRFGTARYVLNRLRNDCDSGQQLRFMFPAVMHLCRAGVNERMDRWIEKFGAYKPCKYTPAISPAFKAAIQDSAALLTTVALLGDDVEEQPAGFVSISEYQMEHVKVDGASTRRI